MDCRKWLGSRALPEYHLLLPLLETEHCARRILDLTSQGVLMFWWFLDHKYQIGAWLGHLTVMLDLNQIWVHYHISVRMIKANNTSFCQNYT